MLTVYDKEFNKFCRKYLIKGNGYDEKELVKTALNDYQNIITYVASLFLYYDSICFDIYGENILIPFMISLFGQKGFENLIEQGAIKFLLQTTTIVHPVEPIKGIIPLMTSSGFTTEVHSNPEASITEGLSRSTYHLDRKYKRSIKRKLLKVYNVHPKDLNVKVVDDIKQKYENNQFATLNFPNIKNLTDFNKQEIKKLATITNDYFDLAILSNFRYSSLAHPSIISLNDSQFSFLKKADLIKTYNDKIFQFEKIPNFPELIKDGKIDLKDIPEFRKQKNSVKFRNWLNSLVDKEFNEFDIHDYLDAIDNNKNFWNTNIGKFTRSMSVFAVSSVLTAPLAGVSAVGIGAGLSLLDTFYIDALTQNWSPRFYIKENVEKLINK